MNKKMKQSMIAFLSIIVLVALDQWTKALAIGHLKGKEAFVLIKDVLVFRYLENIGAAFSSMMGKTAWLLGSTSVMILILAWLYLKMPETKKWTLLRICIVAIIAGGIGNFIDRVRFHYVVDFIYFKLINFPTFNVADCYVTVAVFVLFFLIVFKYKDSDYDEIKERMPKWLQKKKTDEKDNH